MNPPLGGALLTYGKEDHMKSTLAASGMAAALAALVGMAAVPDGGTVEKCAKCMDYNHCNWYDPPVGRNSNCTNFPCEYTGEDCDSEVMALQATVGREEMRLPDGRFTQLISVGDGWFAEYNCDNEIVALARKIDGELIAVDDPAYYREFRWGNVKNALALQ